MPESDYRLLDSGAMTKLEQLGDYRVARPCLQAVWPRHLQADEWERADAVYVRHANGNGEWTCSRPLPAVWPVRVAGHPWLLKPTGFGHLGLFPEQVDNWAWLEQRCRSLDDAHALNLFAYTGGSTFAMARGGASVTHVDAARGVVAWARDNAREQGLPETGIRWLVDDAMKFGHRERRRGRRYRGIVLDPPTFGRGPTGEFWKIESDLHDLLAVCRDLLADSGPAFVLLSSHTPGFTPLVLSNCLRAALGPEGAVEAQEMTLAESDGTGRLLPAGVSARWVRG